VQETSSARWALNPLNLFHFFRTDQEYPSFDTSALFAAIPIGSLNFFARCFSVGSLPVLTILRAVFSPLKGSCLFFPPHHRASVFSQPKNSPPDSSRGRCIHPPSLIIQPPLSTPRSDQYSPPSRESHGKHFAFSHFYTLPARL